MDPNGKAITDNERIRIGDHVSIYRRGKKGIFNAEFHHRGHRRKSLRTRSKKVAKKRALEIELQLSEGTYGQVAKGSNELKAVNLSQAQSDFRTYLETEGRRPKTIVKYMGILKSFSTFAGNAGINDVSSVELSLIDAYRALRKETLSPKSMHHEGALLKLFLRWCEERNLIRVNPLRNRTFAPPRPKDQAAPSVVQVNQILEAATKLRYPQLAFLAFTGARSGELRYLKACDVDLAGNWIHLRSRVGAENKSDEDRKVPIHPRLRAILEPLQDCNDGWFFRALPSNRYPNGDHHINTKRLNEDLTSILKRLKIPAGRDGGFTVHSLRRFFRTTAVNSGVPERAVDLWLGHRDRNAMGSIYYHLSDEDSQRFMQQVRLPVDAI